MTKVCGKIRTGSLPENLEAGETENKESRRCGGSHMGKNEMFRISIGLFYNINKQSDVQTSDLILFVILNFFTNDSKPKSSLSHLTKFNHIFFKHKHIKIMCHY